MEKSVTGARFIAQTLQAYEVEYVFLIPAILRRALVEMEGLGIRRVVPHCEKSAAYMADGYARVSRKPGIVMAQSVGAANLAAGLQDAYLARSPLIAITGRKPSAFQHRNAYQEILHHEMFNPVTKYNANIDTVEQLPHLFSQAFREATSGAPRPVHLELMGLAGEVIEAATISLPVRAEPRYTRAPALRIEPAASDIREAARLITAADRPVIVAGGGAIASGAQAQVLKLAEAFSIPVASSCTAKAVIPSTHPLSAGIVGSYSMRCANQIVSGADLVIYVGSSVGDQVTHNWTIPREGTPVIQIDIEPAELGRNCRNTHGILGDARLAITGLVESLQGADGKAAWARQAAEIVASWRAELEPLLSAAVRPMRPERLCRELSTLVPQDAILVADTGYSAIWTATMLDLVHQRQTYLRSAGSLGWAFPASLGAKLAAPQRPVVCFTGDGGMWYHLSDLETAKRWKIHTVTVINNNSGFGQSRVGTNRAYADSPGNPHEIYSFEKTNFARLARDMGCLGIEVEAPEEIPQAFQQALASDLPAVIDVATEPTSVVPALWEPSVR